jgi:hypothetical protein
MKKTILLTQNPNRLTTTVSKWLFVLVGLPNVINGIDKLREVPLTNWGLFLGGFLLLTGLAMIIMGFILFDSTSKLAPKFEIDEVQILVKEDIFKKTKLLNWNEITEISFKPFALEFMFTDKSSQLVILKTTGETSIEIKKSIREIADKKLINIVGG